MDDYLAMSIATKSTAARMDVPVQRPKRAAPSNDATYVDVGASTDVTRVNTTAGTQAPPVDTKSKRGRPATGFDRKAYQAQKARERRAKGKAK
jgi:hypothetical protein